MIDRNLDLGAVAQDAEDMAADLRLEHRLQRRTDPRGEQRLERRVIDPVKIGVAAGNLPLPFEALDQVGLALGRLYGLHDMAAVLADAEIDAGLAQRAVRRVEVGRDQLMLFLRRGARPQRRVGGEPRGIGRIEFEFELDLFCLARRVTSHDASHCSDATACAGTA